MPSKRKMDQQKRMRQRKIDRANDQKRPGGQSKYGRKEAFLLANGGWGFEYPNKPWK